MAREPPAEFCFTDPTTNLCGIMTDPMGNFPAYFDALMPGGFGILIIFAPIVMAVWLKTKSPHITAIVGIIIATTYTAGTNIAGINETAIGIGATLVAVSLAIYVVGVFKRTRTVY